MAGGKLDLFQAGSLAKSINSHMPDFQADVQLTAETINVTSGIVEGIGPRYGFSPMAGHMDQETPASGNFPGLMRWELGLSFTGGGSTWTRSSLIAIIPITLKQPGDTGDISISETYYAYVICYFSNLYSEFFIDVLLSATIPGSLIEQSSDITAGLQYAGLDSMSDQISRGQISLLAEKIVVPEANNTTITNYVTGAGGQRDVLSNVLQNIQGNQAFWAAAIPFSVTGPDVPMNWLLGSRDAFPDATHAPSLTFSGNAPSGSAALATGLPSSFNYGNFPQTTRNWTVYTISSLNSAGIIYTATHQATTSIFLPTYVDDGSKNFDASGFTWSKSGGTSYSSVDMGLLNDPLITTSSSYQGVAIASGGSPILVLYQDWYRSYIGEMQQYVDPTSMPAPDTNGPAALITFGAANSGILRANTNYEFGASIYDKRLNFETNVVSVQTKATSTDDFVSAILFDGHTLSTKTNADNAGEAMVALPNLKAGAAANTVPAHLNYLQYRFYFRQVGMSEWLPGLYVDASQYWFYPWDSTGATGLTACVMCIGAIGGLPGGRVGGFNDYSTLAPDTYNCVVMYKSRMFWLSEKALSFSLINNIFAYPGTNTASCPLGSFKGAIVQAYYGQAEQDARLVVFGTKATYVGKFTGQQIQTPVTLSAGPPGGPPVIGNFGLDGSDFVLNTWTSVTAFSYRAATVAEGILYFWGPQGVFQDDGVNPLTRISVPIEPDIFSSYDPSQTDAINCVYNDTTKEITWFFAPTPADASYPTHGIIWNRVKNSWLYVKYNGVIDGAQVLNSDTSGVTTAGARTVVFARHSSGDNIQRAYYYDQLNLCGDMLPDLEMMVKTISTPSTGVRRLTLAAGYQAGIFSSISIGDYIALQQCAAYAGSALTTPSDFIATVHATNSGAGTIDITLPTGATLDASATIASNANFFPIWHSKPSAPGLNGIPYVLDTKFWVPNGMSYWAYWLYLHLVFQLYDLLPGPAPTITLNYQTPISVGNQLDSLTLSNNSQGNCQIFHPLRPGSSSFEGQGLKITFSGIQLAGAWVLQFLEAYSQLKDGMQLKMFEQ